MLLSSGCPSLKGPLGSDPFELSYKLKETWKCKRSMPLAFSTQSWACCLFLCHGSRKVKGSPRHGYSAESLAFHCSPSRSVFNTSHHSYADFPNLCLLSIWLMVVVTADNLGSHVMWSRHFCKARSWMIRMRMALMLVSASSGNF